MFFPIKSVVIISTENIIYLPFILFMLQFSSVQSLSRVWLFATPWIAARQASLSITNSWSLLKLMPIESVMPSSHLIPCRPLLLLPPIPPSIRVFSNESTLHMRWPKYWSFSFSISPSNEHSGLISFRMDWLDLLAVQGTLKSLLNTQFKSINFLALRFLHSPTLTSICDHWSFHAYFAHMSCVYCSSELFIVVHLLSYDPMDCRASLSFTISWSLFKLRSIESVMPSNHLIPDTSCEPDLSPA